MSIRKTEMKRFATALMLLAFTNSIAFAEGNRSSKILTQDLATKCLGVPVKASMVNTMNDTEIGKVWVSRTMYDSLGDDNKTCGILIRHANSKDEAISSFHGSKDLYKGTTVAGFGDEAYRVSAPSPQFNVLKGQNWLIIHAGTRKAADNAAQEMLAKEILSKVSAD